MCQPIVANTNTLAVVLALLLTITGASQSAQGAQKKAPTPKPPKHEFSFIVLGDSQLDHPVLFNRVINDVAQMAPSFVVQVGDLIDGYSTLEQANQEWDRFRAQIGPLQHTTFVPVPGNHDIYGKSKTLHKEMTDLYRAQWGKDYQKFSYRNSLFIILNSDAVGTANSVTGEQFRWLAKTLAAAGKYRHRFVFIHRPPALLKNADELHQLFARHQVSFVFYGHHHHLHQQVKDGVTYIMTNAAATSGVTQEAAGSFPHFLNVSVRGPRAKVAVVKADAVLSAAEFDPWDNYDLFALTKRLAPPDVNLTLERSRRDRSEHQQAAYTLAIPLTNNSRRSVQVFAHCHSNDNRWHFTPRQLAPITLAAGESKTLSTTAAQTSNALSETTPSCTLGVPFQTKTGAWLQHQVDVTTSLP